MVLLKSGVQIGDISLVVLLVMDDHNLCRDNRLQRVEIIWQIWEDVYLNYCYVVTLFKVYESHTGAGETACVVGASVA